MKTISNGAQLNKLAISCSENENELSQITNSMDKELSNVTQKINSQLIAIDNNILVIFQFLYFRFVNSLLYFCIFRRQLNLQLKQLLKLKNYWLISETFQKNIMKKFQLSKKNRMIVLVRAVYVSKKSFSDKKQTSTCF